MEQIIKQETFLTEEQKYITLHNQIMQYGNMAITCYAEFAKKLKEMRDSKLYRASGIETFGEYVEKEVGIKERQAYNYIKVYEEFSEEFLQSNAKLGITKLSLLAPLSEDKRQELMEEVDVENTSVRELQKEIEERESKIVQMEIDFGKYKTESEERLQKITAEKEKLEKQTSLSKQYKEQLDKFKKEKQLAEQKIKELENAPATVQTETVTVDNPETVKELESAKSKMAELETECKTLQKKLEIANDENMVKFKAKFEDLQRIGEEMFVIIDALPEDKKTKCMQAIKAVVGGWKL